MGLGRSLCPATTRPVFIFLAENSIDIICRAGLDMVLHYVSPSSFHVLGWKPEEMTGKRPDAFFLPEDASALAGNSLAIVRMRMKDGMMAWVEIKHRMVCDSVTGVPRENIIVIRDITERKTLEESSPYSELTDSRTGLFTARAFDEALEREWNRTLREGSFLSLLLLDFNHFRQFHDWREHLEGDRCLGQSCRRGSARLAGYGFCCALRRRSHCHHSSFDGPAVVQPESPQRCVPPSSLSVLTLNVKLEGHGWVTVNIGISTVLARAGGTARMPEILLLAADNALHRAMHQETESQAMAAPMSPMLRDKP